jgi:hypothetical protein
MQLSYFVKLICVVTTLSLIPLPSLAGCNLCDGSVRDDDTYTQQEQQEDKDEDPDQQ